MNIVFFFVGHPWLLNFLFRRFGTLTSFFIGRLNKKRPMKMERSALPQRKRAGTNYTGDWMGLGTGLHEFGKSEPPEFF